MRKKAYKAAWFHSGRSVLFAVTFIFVLVDHALAKRAIPDDNLAYPVLITLKTMNGATLGFGSGFYLNTDDATYLVTAKHVLAAGLPDPGTQKVAVPDVVVELLSYSKDLPTPKRILIAVNLSTLRESGNVKAHASQDVVAIKVATLVPNGGATRPVSLLSGVTGRRIAAAAGIASRVGRARAGLWRLRLSSTTARA